MAITADMMLAEARRHLGVKEVPNGSNKTVFGKQYGWDGVAWCAIFVSCLFMNLNALALVYGKNAYTPTWAKKFYDAGQWDTKPKKGALVFFAWGTGTGRWKGIQHVGVVEAVNTDGSFITIEGNVGNRVQRLRRSMTYVAGFGYPKYAVVAAPKPTPEPAFPLPRYHVFGYDPYRSSMVHSGRESLRDKSFVMSIQRKLVANGFSVGRYGVDGVIGRDTDSAIRKFQAKAKISQDGKVGPITWSKLF